jgi:predicted lipoprotein with Yx(FWY)xxD motif
MRDVGLAGHDFKGISMRKFTLSTALAGFALLAACASAEGPAKVGDSSLGKVLTDAKGMTLYTFDRDAPGKSNCNGQCAQSWPPLLASVDAKPTGEWSVVTRDDGSKMWAYKGKPLYTWVKDTKAGDTTGESVNNVWRVAKP